MEMGGEVKMDARMMAAPRREAGNGGVRGRGGGCPWIRPRYNLILWQQEGMSE